MSSNTKKEIFRTTSGCVYQCDKNYRYWVDFAGHVTSFNVYSFFALRTLIKNINLDRMVNNPEKAFDIEIINIRGSDRCFALSISQIIEFKELLSGAHTMIELNSILSRSRTFIGS